MKAEQRLAERFLASHPADAAPLLERAATDNAAAVLRGRPAQQLAALLQRMEPRSAGAILIRLPDRDRAALLDRCSLGVAASMLSTLSIAEREQQLDALPDERARPLRAALEHPDGTAGALMEATALEFGVETSVGQARRIARRRAGRGGSYLYVVDGERRLVGALASSELLFASPRVPLGAIMRTSVHSLRSNATTPTILAHPAWRELHAIPVVDGEGVLVGVLRRENYERLREASHGGDAPRDLAVDLAELVWTAMLSTFGGPSRPRGRDDE